MSELFVRTLREDPADAEVPSHRWLVRAGYIRRAGPGIYTWLPLGYRVVRNGERMVRASYMRRAGAGIYTWLPLGYRVLRNVERIVREEMNAIGAQEVHFPAL